MATALRLGKFPASTKRRRKGRTQSRLRMDRPLSGGLSVVWEWKNMPSKRRDNLTGQGYLMAKLDAADTYWKMG